MRIRQGVRQQCTKTRTRSNPRDGSFNRQLGNFSHRYSTRTCNPRYGQSANLASVSERIKNNCIAGSSGWSNTDCQRQRAKRTPWVQRTVEMLSARSQAWRLRGPDGQAVSRPPPAQNSVSKWSLIPSGGRTSRRPTLVESTKSSRSLSR